MKEATIYQQLLDLSSDYLGPASKRFIDRQIVNHLKKEPEKLKPQDMPTLVNWTKVALAFLTEDSQLINEFVSRMQSLDKEKETAN
jgi:hypothetical protein